MEFYSREFKQAARRRMLPPENARVSRLAKEIGVTETTLYAWRKDAQMGATTEMDKPSDSRSSADKFLIVLETYPLNEAELSEYCRKKGLYQGDIAAWREFCLNANAPFASHKKQLSEALREEKKRSQTLEKELNRKEKALAEAAALLILRKKAQAIWGDPEDE